MNNQDKLKEIEKLFSLGAHLGHKKSRLHPRARKNVYQIINGTSVIDLTNTVEQMETAKDFLKKSGKDGKKIMVVGTKKTASSFVKDFCSKNNLPFVSTKWLPGTLTNFKTIMENVSKLKENREQLKKENSVLVKHEVIKLQKDTAKLERLYGGISSITQRPDVIFIIDAKKESNAVKEAKSYNIPVVALIDTNTDPENIDYPVVANDDTAEVVEYISKQLLEAYIEGTK